MHKEAQEALRVRLKLVVIELASHLGVTKACREFEVPRSSYYRWKQKYEKAGPSGLYRERPIAYRHPRRTPPAVEEKILELRREYQFGALRIKYYLERYHGIRISESTVSRVLKSHGVERLPRTAPRRALHTKWYAKTVPGHHIQVDVKFLQLKNREGKTLKRYQSTASDDATRIRALQIFPEHNQAAAIRFLDYVIQTFPFRISTIRTDQTEFYQLLTYTDDVDLNAKLKAWENFYNYDRPHLALAGKTPYEVMKSLLQ